MITDDGQQAQFAGALVADQRLRQPGLPFGGYKHSGNGREFGRHGLEEYLETIQGSRS